MSPTHMVGIGPDAKGRFHPTAIENLREAGAWLKVNGEAIYATRPRDGDLWHEGDHVRYTQSKDGRSMYAITDEWPGDVLTLKTVRAKKGSTIELLGTTTPLEWTQDDRGLSIRLPASLSDPVRRPSPIAWAFRIQPTP